MNTTPLGPWPTGMNLRSPDASLGSDPRLLVNVDLDETGRVSARPQHALTLALPGAHSLTAYSGRLYGIHAGQAFSWAPGDSAVTYRTAVGKAAMCWDVYAGELYGVSPSGLVRFGADHALLDWGQYPEETDANGVRFTAPQPAPLFAVFLSHLLFASGNVLTWTEPFQPQVTAPYRNFVQLPEPIVMLAALDSGVWAASAHRTWFLQGRNPSEWVLHAVSDCGALGAATHRRDSTAYWLTESGFAVGDEQGRLTLPQEDAVALTCGGSPAILRAPWRPELFVATLPEPNALPQTSDSFLDSTIQKGT